MITKIQVDRSQEISSRLFFDGVKEVKRINLLFGGNGAGKTSFLRALSGIEDRLGQRNKLKKEIKSTVEGAPYLISYSNSFNNYQNMEEFTEASSLYSNLITKHLSEGQTVQYSIAEFLIVLRHLADEDTEYIITADEIDSGLDAASARLLVTELKRILESAQNLQIFISFNNYELTKLTDTWFNMYTGQYENCPKTYEEYINILTTYKEKFPRDCEKEEILLSRKEEE